MLAAAATGGPLPDDLVRALVNAVLDDESVRLALALRDDGGSVVRRAIELAGVIVSPPETEVIAPVVDLATRRAK